MQVSEKHNTVQQLRLRIFAGPNGSGKSTIIQAIRNARENGKLLDFGIYINADDIANALSNNEFSFSSYQIQAPKPGILLFAESSGLLNNTFSIKELNATFEVKDNKIILIEKIHLDRLAQIIARYLRETLLKERKRFSFETVFSHESNLDIMRRATDAGYKVYLYFVSTESPEINKYRVKLRVKQNGHNVPEDRIEKRYFRSLELMYQAAQIAYQAFFFDNSVNNKPYTLVGHFKKFGTKKVWDKIPKKDISKWFKKYYNIEYK